MNRSLPQLRTSGVIAQELGESLSRVLYVLRTRQHIKPAALAGRLRPYDRRAVAMVRHEFHAIDARRSRQVVEDAPSYVAKRHGRAVVCSEMADTSGGVGEGRLMDRL